MWYDMFIRKGSDAMKKSRKWLILIILIIFILLDLWNGNTYHFMNVGSMIYLSFFFLLIAAVWLLNREGYKKFIGLFTSTVLVFALVFVVGGLMSSRVLNAKRFANVIGTVNHVEFKDLYGKDHKVEMSLVDKESALLAAEKKMGELSDVSARFKINSREFSQINYQGNMVRIAPFQYTDPLKQLINLNKGVPYYVRVTTGAGATNAQAEIVKLDKPMRYYPGAPLHYDLKRHVALQHKFSFLSGWHFEIDESGHPFWVIQTIKKEVGLWGANNTSGIIVVDAVSGASKEYKVGQEPEWVDLVYPTNMLLSHAKDHYALSGGYINSIVQQDGVKLIDQEIGTYNYVLIDNEIYVFTGIRPVTLDEGSTTGLLFMNMKTSEAIVLDLPGISLTAAEQTSIGSIQEKNYEPITPVLQNIGGYPTYVMSLKDRSGVIRSFSFVNYQDYTKSAVGVTLKDTERSYLSLFGDEESLVPEDVVEMEAVIADIRQVYIDGNTIYYILFEDQELVYQASLQLNDKLPFYQAGDTLKFKVSGQKIVSFEVE